MLDLTLLLPHLFFADSISVMIESSVATLFVRHLLPKIGFSIRLLRADHD